MQLFMIMLTLIAVIAVMAVYYMYFVTKLTFYKAGWMDQSMGKYKVYSAPRLSLFDKVTGLKQSDIKSLNQPDVNDLAKLAKAVPVYLKSVNNPVKYNFICVGSNGVFELYNVPNEVTPKEWNVGINFVDGVIGAALFSYKV